MISVRFQGKPFNFTVIQVYAPTTNVEEVEAEQFCDDLQDLLELCVTSWTVAHQAPLTMGFSRQEYWSGLPCPPPGIFLTWGLNPLLLLLLHCRWILYP